MEHLIVSVDSENTLIIGLNQYSPVAMIAEVGKYSELSKKLSDKKEHKVYFDTWRVQGLDSAHRFVEVSVENGVSDKYGFYIIPEGDIPVSVLESASIKQKEILK